MIGALHQSQAVLRAVLESPENIIIFALDGAYRYLAFNRNHARTMKAIWGVDLAVGASILDLIPHTDDRERARRNFDRALSGESFTLVEEYGSEALSRRVYENVYSPIRDERGAVIGLTVYLTDITEQRRAELELERYRNQLEELVRQRTVELEAAHGQLLQAQKFESLGLLAGGIAHDFNNLLAVILGRAELALATLHGEHPARQHVELILQTALDARLLPKQLLGYAGRGKFMIQTANLNELVADMAELLRGAIGKATTLSLELSPEPLLAEIDVAQVRQVLLNLVTNAAEAVGEGPGQIVVRTRVMDVNEETLREARASSGTRPGTYACVEVEDSGCGMDEMVLSKLFDPFFTTKFSGRGLGLSAAQGIVTGHHGAILVRSSKGQGSCLTVLLPRSSAVQVSLDTTAAKPTGENLGALVLVVDDEEPVLLVTAEVLKEQCYRVLTSKSGRDALEVYRQHASDVSLVLLDLTMPGMNGEDTLRALQALRPDVKVVLMTGYTEDEVRLRFMHGELAGFLTKPFSTKELVATIEAAIKAPRPRLEARP